MGYPMQPEFPAPPPMLDGTDGFGRPVVLLQREAAPPPAPVSYAQALGNSRLDSIARARIPDCHNFRQAPALTVSYQAPSHRSLELSPPRWLLGANETVIATGDCAYLVVDLASETTIVAAGLTKGWAAFVPGGQAYYVRVGDSLVERTVAWRAGREGQRIVRAPWLDESVELCAFAFPSETDSADLLVGVVEPASVGAGRSPRTVLRRLRLESAVEVSWERNLLGQAGRIPVTDDCTIIVPLSEGQAIHRVRSDGAALPFTDSGRISPDHILLRRNLVSVDQDGSVFGCAEEHTQLCLKVLSREAQFTVPLPRTADTPLSQPPVLLPDGRTMLVEARAITCVESFSVAWTRRLLGGEAIATGTLDNYLAVCSGCQVLVLNRNGHEVWSATTPRREPICTNPLVTADGRICVGTATAIHCFAP